MKIVLSSCAVVLLCVLVHVQCYSYADKTFMHKTFRMVKTKVTQAQARAYCGKLWGGLGRLVAVANAAENDFIYKYFGANQHVWLGGDDRAHEGRWVWSTGCTMRGRYSNWLPKQPNNYRNEEDCMHMYAKRGGKWNDVRCSYKMMFVCQKFIKKDFCENLGPNIAKGKNAYQSTLTWKGHPKRATDGNTASNYWKHSCTHTNNGKQNWLVVDLGSAHKVSAIKLFNRQDCCANRLRDLTVSVSDDPKPKFSNKNTIQPANAHLCQHIKGTVGATATIKCKGATGRYIFIAKHYTLTLCEVQAFGTAAKEFQYFKNNVYYVEKKKPATWVAAEKFCRTLWKGKGRLVNVESTAENRFLMKAFNNKRKSIWIGGNDRRHEGFNVWSNGCPVKNNKKNPLWYRGEPNNCCGGEDCMTMNAYGGRWNDARCTKYKFLFACEREQAHQQCRYLGPNIARGKKAWQSSTSKFGVASRATDGNENQIWSKKGCTHTGNRGPNFLFIDLGRFYKINHVELLNRRDCCSNLLSDFAVSAGYVYDDDRYNMKFTNLVPTGFKLCKFQKSAVRNSIFINCNGAVGRHIAIIKRTNVLTVCEVKAYGTKTAKPIVYCKAANGKKYKVGQKWSDNAKCQNYQCTKKGAKILSTGCRQDGKCYSVGQNFEDKKRCLKMRCTSSKNRVAITERGCKHASGCKTHKQHFLESNTCKKFHCNNGKLLLKETGCRKEGKCVSHNFQWMVKSLCRHQKCVNGRIELVKQDCPLLNKCVKRGYVYYSQKYCAGYKCASSGKMLLETKDCKIDTGCLKSKSMSAFSVKTNGKQKGCTVDKVKYAACNCLDGQHYLVSHVKQSASQVLRA